MLFSHCQHLINIWGEGISWFPCIGYGSDFIPSGHSLVITIWVTTTQINLAKSCMFSFTLIYCLVLVDKNLPLTSFYSKTHISEDRRFKSPHACFLLLLIHPCPQWCRSQQESRLTQYLENRNFRNWLNSKPIKWNISSFPFQVQLSKVM